MEEEGGGGTLILPLPMRYEMGTQDKACRGHSYRPSLRIWVIRDVGEIRLLMLTVIGPDSRL